MSAGAEPAPGAGPVGAGDAGERPAPPETEQLQRDIERTREQLGDTVEALAAKSDVKAQAKEKMEQTKASVSDKADELLGKARAASPESASGAASATAEKARQNPLPLAAAGAFALGFLFGRVTKR